MVNSNTTSTASTPLLEWSLGAFHTSLFFWLFVIVLYLTGSLGNLLASLNTILGVIIFVFLWVTTWFWTRFVVRQALNPGTLSTMQIPPVRILLLGLWWGGINGLTIFLIPFVLALIVAVGATLVSRSLTEIPAVLVLFGASFEFGIVLSFGIGMIFGIIFALLDLLLLGVSQLLFALNAGPTNDGGRRTLSGDEERMAEPQ